MRNFPFFYLPMKWVDALSHTWGFSRGVVHVCLSLDLAANSGTREDSSVFVPGSVDSPRLAQTAVVQLSSGVVSSARSLSPFPSYRGIFCTPPQQCSCFTPGCCQGGVSRTGILCLCCRLPGSDGTATTSLVYDRKCDIFCTWCTERQTNPISVSIKNLGNFLLFLFEVCNLAASTVRAFETAISSALSPRQIGEA